MATTLCYVCRETAVRYTGMTCRKCKGVEQRVREKLAPPFAPQVEPVFKPIVFPDIPQAFVTAVQSQSNEVPDPLTPQQPGEMELSESEIRLTIDRMVRLLGREMKRIQQLAKDLELDPNSRKMVLVLDHINKVAAPLSKLIELRMKLKKQPASGMDVDEECQLFLEWFKAIPKTLQEQVSGEMDRIVKAPRLAAVKDSQEA